MATEWTNESWLRERLATCLRGAGANERVSVAVYAEGRAALAIATARAAAPTCASGRGAEPNAARALRAPMRPGCITKLFTAELALNACESGRLRLDGDIGSVLDIPAARACGISVRQLLEHTHGLDDSLLDAAPLDAHGFIDAEALIDAVNAVDRLAAPGTVYSYANVGAWLLAALLEHIEGVRYDELLRARILAPLSIEHESTRVERGPAARRICPATGGALNLPVTDMLEFLQRHGIDRIIERADNTYDMQITPLPGRSVLERGIYLGWKYHGGGWFGHSSSWADASALVRVHPRRRVALVVASRVRAATVLAAQIFGMKLPELATFGMPRPLKPEQVRALQLARFEGVYRCARFEAAIRQRKGRLEVLTAARDSAGGSYERTGRSRLLPAEEGLFFLESPNGVFPYIQLVEAPASAAFLWNGRFVLPKRG